MDLSEHAAANRAYWDRKSDEYQSAHGEQLAAHPMAWGAWSIPESELNILGDVVGKDVLEFGCGAAQWSIALTKRGARCVGLDNSERQLEHARANRRAAGVDFPLIHASAENVPLPGASFDIVFCDHGAMTFADPFRTVPEAARLLRPAGLFAFSIGTPILFVCWDKSADRIGTTLREDYFDLRRDDDGSSVVFTLPYGKWIELFRDNGFEIEALIELRPPPNAQTTYNDFVTYEWARNWPSEHVWRVRLR
jgi:SAM-dependent methyltransferase